MTDIDCPMTTCVNNVNKECIRKFVSLKWRFAADLGKGNIVCMECLHMEIAVQKEDTNGG